jgi:alkylation response protein AidB-like acyl-CoA dehydrogenase
MKNKINQSGGAFLIQSFYETSIYCREKFKEEHLDIERMIKKFSRERIFPNKHKVDNYDKELSLKLIREAGGLGLLGIEVPTEYGGIDLDLITSAINMEAITFGYSFSFLATFSVQSGIGLLPILWFGTKKQKEKYLNKLVSGKIIGAYGLTESSAGSDALSAKTKAVLSEDGKHYILNGEKIFITNGGWADVFTVFAQVDDNKFSAFIVDRDTPGFETGPEEKKMGINGSSTTPLIFSNAKIPVSNLLYEVGKGATIAFNVLNLGRFKLGAAVIGGMKMTIDFVIKYALDRRQFGQSISKMDVIKGKLAQMIIQTYTADSMIYRTIGLMQEGINILDKSSKDYYLNLGKTMEEYAIESSMAKIYGSEAMSYVIDEGIQIMGGYGFMEEYPLAEVYRSNRINRIWEGTNEINRQIITGYMIKKTLMEDLPVRESIKKIDDFLDNESIHTESDLLFKEKNALDTGKNMALYLFHEALNEYGQDLKHEQQLTEIFADIFLAIFTVESTIGRVEYGLESGKSNSIVLEIARVYTAQVSLELLGLLRISISSIHKGKHPESFMHYYKRFEERMTVETDIIGLKKNIAEYAFSNKGYLF